VLAKHSLNPEVFAALQRCYIVFYVASPDDMLRLELKNGDRVRLRTEQGEIEIPCQLAKAKVL
jgi:formylmethanofuran dehydrogenase subunit D